MKKIWISGGLALALSLAGCGGSKESTETTSAPTAPTGGTATPDEVNGATVTGKVAFTGTAPVMKSIDMSANPACEHAHTTPVKSEEVVVNPNGTLKYAFVWIKSGPDVHDDGQHLSDKNWAVSTTPILLDQHGCMYSPHVIGIMTGQNIQIKNSDPTNHNIHPLPTLNQDWNESQPPQSEDKMKTFPRQEVMITVKCNIHPWMRAYIGAVSHPFFAVTSDDGTYTIKGLPPGTYTVESWHEKYGTQDQQITVGPKDSKTVDFSYKG
jgi:plastocyanin